MTDTPLDDATLDELEAKAKAATLGPWEWDRSIPDPLGMTPEPTLFLAHGRLRADGDGEPGFEDDLTYISAADPETVLALIAELRHLREQLQVEGQDANRNIHFLHQENLRLRAEVAEWFCQGCNRAYPPLAVGRLLQPCPQCDGVLVPSSQNLRELLRLRTRVEELETNVEYLRRGPEGDAWQQAWRKRDLAVAEAVREACAKVASDPWDAADRIRALNLDALIRGIKS